MSVLNGPNEGDWSVFAERMMGQRDALRNLPVIARCYDCAHAETSPHADVCVHPAAGGRVEHGGKLPPPGNCPLREAVGK